MKNTLSYTEIYQLRNFFGFSGRVFPENSSRRKLSCTSQTVRRTVEFAGKFLRINRSRKQRDRCWPPIGKFVPNHRQAFESPLEDLLSQCKRAILKGSVRIQKVNSNTYGFFFDTASYHRSNDEVPCWTKQQQK